MSRFLDDVRSQGQVLRALVGAYQGELAGRLEEAGRTVADAGERPIVVVGMGSSLAAGRILPPLAAASGRLVSVVDAGELLHYGLGSARSAGVVIAISQSGRSVETMRVVDELRAIGRPGVVALVNDPGSPLARAADTALPLLAGEESAVATKTFVATIGVLVGLAEAAALPSPGLDALLPVSEVMDAQLVGHGDADAIARHLGRSRALLLIARGPALGVAEYAALTIKEAAAMPAEAMSGGAFRHGPIELLDADVSIVVLAPSGTTTDLTAGLAHEVAGSGRPTWLLTDEAHARSAGDPGMLRVTHVPSVPESLAPLGCVVPLQLVMGALARAAGREVGAPTVATKVTERE